MTDITGDRLATKRSQIYERECSQCGEIFWVDATRAAQRYCSAAWRQRAYRQRKAQWLRGSH